MGAVTGVTITGAAGFIGRATVAEARSRGLVVTAVVRGDAPMDWAADDGVQVVTCDLSQPTAPTVLSGALGDGPVIHAAASLAGTATEMQADTLRGTRHMMAGLGAAGVQRLILVSSIAVYDTEALPLGGTLSEACPLYAPEAAPGTYATAKAQQERIVAEAATAQGLELSILRPGAVFGRNRLWNGHLGAALGPVLVRVGGAGEVPVCHVRHCARALVDAALAEAPVTVNVIDDDRPDRARYVAALRAQGWPRLVLPLPWQILLPAARLLSPLSSYLPGLLKAPVLRARMTPLGYDTGHLHATLGFAQTAPFEDLMAEAAT